MKSFLQSLHPILFVLGIFFCLIASDVFSEGMFFDGITYASISRNMAEGLGTFWRPYFADVAFPVFYEHPPLALGIQALFFKLFGDTIYIERVYSLLNLLLSVFLIARIWKRISKQPIQAYLPILFFLMNGAIIWAAPNNMLESTMLNFLLCSVLFFFKSIESKRFYNLLISGLFITAAFLTKGPTALYLWVLPFWYYIIMQKKGIFYSITQGLQLAGLSILPLLFIFIIQSDSFAFFQEYLDRQVFRSLTSVQNVSTRLFILKDFLVNNALGISSVAITLFVAQRRKKVRKANRLAYVFVLTALCGVLPVMISLKQSGHYVLTTYPIFSIGISLLILPYLQDVTTSIFSTKVFRLVSFSAIVISIFLLFKGIGTVNRNSDLIEFTRAISAQSENISIAYVDDIQRENYPLHAYLMRYNRISLSKNEKLTYHIIKSSMVSTDMGSVVVRTKEYILLKK